MPIKVAIRADAGRALGTGHYARASAVVDALSSVRNTEILLVTGQEGGDLVPAYFPAGIPILTLPPEDSGPVASIRALRLRGWLPDVIYLDHYGEVSQWEAQAAEAGARLLVLDDLDAATEADVIVRPHGGKAGMAESVVLRGPANLPLSSHVASLAARSPSPAGRTRLKLNVCFGGSDPTGETGKALQALATLNHVDADVVIGPGASADRALIKTAEELPHVTLHRAPSQKELADLISKADLALGAGGVMLWERLCMGVPSLVISVAQNQRPQIDSMVAVGAVRFAGSHDELDSAALAQAVAALAKDEPARRGLAEAGRRLVDGRGAARLAGWIRALALAARDVQFSDAERLYEWRTDDRNWQHNWGQTAKPDLAAHLGWVKGKLADPECIFRIVSRHDQPAGVVRFELGGTGSSAYLSIYLVPECRGERLGLPVYLAAEHALRRSHRGVREITSRIHRENEASERLHRDAGFEVVRSEEREDWLEARKRID